MSFFKSLTNFFGGNAAGLGGKIIDTIKDYFPAKLTEPEKADLQLKIQQAAHKIELGLSQQALKADQEFNDRIKQLEGTASDLTQFGWVGRVIVFLRGAQRPVWGYLVAVMDVMVFSKKWEIETGTQMESAFWIINFLVLGFLFGERAIKNIIPLVSEYLSKKK